MVIASVEAPVEFDMAAIAAAAGNASEAGRRYAGGRLFVDGVTQEALETALASYDSSQTDRARLAVRIASRRYEAETVGITLNDMPIDTGRDSQGLIAGAALAAVIDPQYSVNWKAADGQFASLAGQQILAVATAVRAHVQACFDREAALLAELEAGTFTEGMLEEGWPNG